MQNTQLLISYDGDTGIVNVTGPIENLALCYLMLEMARYAIHDYRAPPVVLPAPPPRNSSAANKRGRRF